ALGDRHPGRVALGHLDRHHRPPDRIRQVPTGGETTMTAPPADPYRTFITDVRPRTPNGRAPKAAVGDPVEVRAHLVRDGHGILAAQLRWRRLDGTRSKWAAVPMVVDDHGHARGCFEPE